MQPWPLQELYVIYLKRNFLKSYDWSLYNTGVGTENFTAFMKF